MADQQSLNATFFAFRKRERGGVLLGATVAYAVIALLAGGVFFALNWQGFMDYMAWAMTMSERAAAADPNDPFGAMMLPPSVAAIMPMYFVLLLVLYILLAAYEAACLKWMIHGETSGFLGLSLGADTWRVYFGYWLWFFLFIAAYFVFVILMVVIGAGAIFSMQAAGGDMNAAMMVLPLVFILGLFAFLIFFGVRFAPAAATSIARRRFAFFDAWKVTKGRFWALLGSFVLLFLMYVVGIIVLSIGAGVVMGASVAGNMATLGENAPPEQVFALFASPAVWIPLAVIYLLMIVGAFVFYVTLFGVNARAAALALEEGKITPAAS